MLVEYAVGAIRDGQGSNFGGIAVCMRSTPSDLALPVYSLPPYRASISPGLLHLPAHAGVLRDRRELKRPARCGEKGADRNACSIYAHRIPRRNHELPPPFFLRDFAAASRVVSFFCMVLLFLPRSYEGRPSRAIRLGDKGPSSPVDPLVTTGGFFVSSIIAMAGV